MNSRMIEVTHKFNVLDALQQDLEMKEKRLATRRRELACNFRSLLENHMGKQ